MALELHPRRPAGRFPLAGRGRDRLAAGLGELYRRVQLLPRPQPETGRHRAGHLLRSPRRAEAGKEPPYFVEQFYGSGRVFYMGSGEMWRLRRLDPAYFDQFYTKLIRHVSQGRLLRGSSRGVLCRDKTATCWATRSRSAPN